MINTLADYRYVQGDIGLVQIDGAIMPVRRPDDKKALKGEDLCFMIEAHKARTALWDGAVFKMSGAADGEPPEEVTLSCEAEPFSFTRRLSIRQLMEVADMHTEDSEKRPGAGSPGACSPFFLAREPRGLSGSFDDAFSDLRNELEGIVQDAPLLMPAAALNGRILLQREIEDMFVDNSLFRLYGCGMTDLDVGYGIGPAGDADRFEEDPGGRMGPLDVNNCLFNNMAITYNGEKGVKEIWPKDQFTLASFNDDGDVESAELWGSLMLERDRNGFAYWIWYGKLCDFELDPDDKVWRARRTGWRSWLRGIWEGVAGVKPPSGTSDLPQQNFSQGLKTRLYAPFAVVRPKDRFVW